MRPPPASYLVILHGEDDMALGRLIERVIDRRRRHRHDLDEFRRNCLGYFRDLQVGWSRQGRAAAAEEVLDLPLDHRPAPAAAACCDLDSWRNFHGHFWKLSGWSRRRQAAAAAEVLHPLLEHLPAPAAATACVTAASFVGVNRLGHGGRRPWLPEHLGLPVLPVMQVGYVVRQSAIRRTT